MTKQLTYQKLFDKLQELGYSDKIVEINGSRQHIFQHPKFERAIIMLPDVSLNDPVASMHLNGVRAILKTHGVIEEDPKQVFLQDNHRNGTGVR